MRQYLALSIMSLFVLLAGGCINMTVNTAVNEDGSGTWELGFYFDPSAMEGFGGAMGGETEELDMDIAGGAFGENMDQTITDEDSGITFSSETRTLNETEEWVFIMADIPNAEAWGQLEAASASMEGLSVDQALGDMGMGAATDTEETPSPIFYPVVTIDGEDVRVEVTGVAPAETMDMGEDAGDMSAMMGFFDLNDIFQVTYNITLPTVSDTNGELDAETNTATFPVDWSSAEPLNFYAEGSLK